MDKIGKYEVLRRIGSGGFGEVYEGRDPFIQRRVAIKTCVSEDDSMRQRFLREAQIAGNLEHRNVVTIYDFGLHDEIPYIVQEYLPGEDLDHVIERRDPLSLLRRVDILTQVAEGLEYAHAQGVVHRDVKPANVRLLADGRVKIMDFGIAKLAQSESRLTRTGITLGTAAYLPPEQIRGGMVDGRADQFSFGVTAYELLSGSRPFAGERLAELMAQILDAEPRPLAEVAPQCPPALAALVERCLEKDPASRFASFSDVLAGLRAVRADLAPAAAAVDDRAQQPTRALDGAALRPAADQALRARVEELLGKGQLAAAEAELRLAERGPAGPAGVAELRQRVASERERRRADELHAHLEAARRALVAEDATLAQRECAAALTLDPMSSEAHAILGETRGLAERHRAPEGDAALASLAAAALLGEDPESHPDPAGVAPPAIAAPPPEPPPADAPAPTAGSPATPVATAPPAELPPAETPPAALDVAPTPPGLVAESAPELPLAVELGEAEGLIAAGRLVEARAALDRLRPRVQGDEVLRRQHGRLGATLMQAYAQSKLQPGAPAAAAAPSPAASPPVPVPPLPPAAPAAPPPDPGSPSGDALRFMLEDLPELPPAPLPASPAVVAATAPTTAPGARRRPWGILAAVAGAVLVLAGLGLWLALRGSAPPPRPSAALPAPSLAPGPVAAAAPTTALIVPGAPGSGLTVSLDGAPPLPLEASVEREVPAGEHVLRFGLPGKGEREVRVTVQAGERRLVDLPAPEALTAPAPQASAAPATAKKPRPRRAPTPAPSVAELAPPPPPPPPAPRPVERGDLVEAGPGVLAPKPLRLASPHYPDLARRQGKEASIEVLVLVDENGKVIDARIQQGDPFNVGFDAAALETARASTFQPATKDGMAVKMWRPLRIGFRLK